jgi:hypothetical protein
MPEYRAFILVQTATFTTGSIWLAKMKLAPESKPRRSLMASTLSFGNSTK